MKLNLASLQKHAQRGRVVAAIKPSESRGAVKAVMGKKAKGPVILKSQADRYETYVGTRIPTAAILKQVIGQPLPKRLTEDGYLVVRGDKPGILVRPVEHDEDGNMYRVKDTQLYGSVEALNSTDHKGFKSEIVDKHELMARARKFDQFFEVTRVKTEERVKVWLLNNHGEQYVAGLTVTPHGRLQVLNMESPETWNKKDVQYNDWKAMKGNFNAFFSRS